MSGSVIVAGARTPMGRLLGQLKARFALERIAGSPWRAGPLFLNSEAYMVARKFEDPA